MSEAGGRSSGGRVRSPATTRASPARSVGSPTEGRSGSGLGLERWYSTRQGVLMSVRPSVRLTTSAAALLVLPLALTACGVGEEENPPAEAAGAAEAPRESDEPNGDGIEEDGESAGEDLVAGWREAARAGAYDEFDALCADQFPDDVIEQIAGFTGTGLSQAEMIAPENHPIMDCQYRAFEGSDDS